MSTLYYGFLMVRMLNRLFFALVAFLALQLVIVPVHAQSSIHRLTTTGDVMEFVWSPQGDQVFATREGHILMLDEAQRQITGDLYSIRVGDGANELLAQNANLTRAPMVGDELAFTRLSADGTARVIVYNPLANQEREYGDTNWGTIPQWNREGGTLFSLRDGKLQRTTRTDTGTLFASQSFPDNARVSPSGDRSRSLTRQS
jgi:hypothetical protein